MYLVGILKLEWPSRKVEYPLNGINMKMNKLN